MKKEKVAQEEKETNTADSEAASIVKEAGEEEKPPVKKIRITFDRQLNQQRLYIRLSLDDPTLKQYAADYGYPPEKIEGFKTLLLELDKYYSAQKTAAAAYTETIRIFLEKLKLASASAQEYVAVARVAFRKDPATYAALELDKARKKAYGSWVTQHKFFYEKLLNWTDALTQIAKYNVSQGQLDGGLKELEEVIIADGNKLNAKAEAQKATELKTKAWQKLKRAMRRYHNVMKAVLEDDPQMKEKLGMVTPIEI